MKLLLGKIIICSVDGEIIPLKMMCEDGCNDQPVNKTANLYKTEQQCVINYSTRLK